MPEVNSQAGEEIAAQDQGLAANQAAPQTDPQQEQGPLTVDDYRKIAREEARREAQSQVAKGENRINQRIKEQLGALKLNQQALGLSDDQVAQARQKIVADAFAAEDAETHASSTAPEPDIDHGIRYLNDRIDEVFEVVGTSIEKGDPEFPKLQKVIDESWNDPKGLTKIELAAQKFATEKAARIASSRDGASARVMSGGDAATSGEAPAASGMDYLKRAYKK